MENATKLVAAAKTLEDELTENLTRETQLLVLRTVGDTFEYLERIIEGMIKNADVAANPSFVLCALNANKALQQAEIRLDEAYTCLERPR